jgi:hypothetical protein
LHGRHRYGIEIAAIQFHGTPRGLERSTQLLLALLCTAAARSAREMNLILDRCDAGQAHWHRDLDCGV